MSFFMKEMKIGSVNKAKADGYQGMWLVSEPTAHQRLTHPLHSPSQDSQRQTRKKKKKEKRKRKGGKAFFIYCLSSWVYHVKCFVSFSTSEHKDLSHSLTGTQNFTEWTSYNLFTETPTDEPCHRFQIFTISSNVRNEYLGVFRFTWQLLAVIFKFPLNQFILYLQPYQPVFLLTALHILLFANLTGLPLLKDSS